MTDKPISPEVLREAERLLPCTCNANFYAYSHSDYCAGKHRPAVARAIQDREDRIAAAEGHIRVLIDGPGEAFTGEWKAAEEAAQAWLDSLGKQEGEANEEIELLPCPFCGAVPTDIAEYDGHYHNVPTFYVNCMACDVAKYGKGRDGAIAAWNRRASLSQPQTTNLLTEDERARVRREALEEAAKWHDQQAEMCRHISQSTRADWMGSDIPHDDRVAKYAREHDELGGIHERHARGIRSLIDKPSNGEVG